MFIKLALLAAAVLLQLSPLQAQAVSEGRRHFESNCTPCHNYEKGSAPDIYGQTLNLYGVVGRKAAMVQGFEFSEGLKKSGIVWTEAGIERFITDPKKLIPGTRMELPGINDAKARREIVRFLGSLAQ